MSALQSARRRLSSAALAGVFCACHGGASSGSSVADASSDDGPCVCPESTRSGTLLVPCGAVGCWDGTAFLCSYGTPIPFGSCASDEAGVNDEAGEGDGGFGE